MIYDLRKHSTTIFERDYFSMNLGFASYENGARGSLLGKSHEAITRIKFLQTKYLLIAKASVLSGLTLRWSQCFTTKITADRGENEALIEAIL